MKTFKLIILFAALAVGSASAQESPLSVISADNSLEAPDAECCNLPLDSASVEQPTILSLDQCIELALRNNLQAVSARNSVDAAVALRREAFTKYFPEIAAVGYIFWANHDIIQYNLLDIIELGIIKNGKAAGVQAMQPVFVGGQIVNGNKLAAVGEEVARLRNEQTLNDLRLTTETLYWKLATLKETRRTLVAAIATLDSLNVQVEAAVEAGIVLNNDLLKVQLKRNTYRSEMVDLDNGISLVRMLLSQYVGMGVDGNIDIDVTLPAELPEMPLDLYVPAKDALVSNINYQLLGKNVEAKRLEKRMEIGKNLPTVAVGAGWFYHDLFKQNHNFGVVQIGVAVPISGWWGGAYGIKRKSIDLRNAENEREDLSEKLQIDITDKWNNLTAAHRKMQIEAESEAQSRENLRLSRDYYEAGLSTISELLEAETAVQQANSRYIAAYGAFCTARAGYLIATGR